jgi:hypothetical protein
MGNITNKWKSRAVQRFARTHARLYAAGLKTSLHFATAALTLFAGSAGAADDFPKMQRQLESVLQFTLPANLYPHAYPYPQEQRVRILHDGLIVMHTAYSPSKNYVETLRHRARFRSLDPDKIAYNKEEYVITVSCREGAKDFVKRGHDMSGEAYEVSGCVLGEWYPRHTRDDLPPGESDELDPRPNKEVGNFPGDEIALGVWPKDAPAVLEILRALIR